MAGDFPQMTRLAAGLRHGQTRLAIAGLLFVGPAIVYAALITGGSFDFFAHGYGWQTYNYYALSLSRLSQAIPAEAIAGEGLYIGGHVYMYHGLLPALVRIPLIPFVDLTRVAVAPLIVWTMLVTGQVALQRAVLKVFAARPEPPSGLDVLLLLLVSYALWFSSGAFLLIHSSNFYHESHAAAWMLGAIYLAMLVRDLLIVERAPGALRLAVYATIAGLEVFSKQTFAVGLYVATAALLLPGWAALRAQPLPALLAAARRAVLPLVILLSAGLAYIAIAYARLGYFGSGWSVAHFGYYLIGTRAWRFETMVHQQFSIVRIGPTLFHFVFGGDQWRTAAVAALGGGRVMSFPPAVRHIVLAPLALLVAGVGGYYLVGRIGRSALALQLIGVTAGVALIGLIQMAYATMQFRYCVEVWPFILWLIMVALRDLPSAHRLPAARPAAAAAAALTLLSLGYAVHLRPLLSHDHPVGRGSLWAPLPAELAARATAPDARATEIVLAAPDPER